MVYSGGYLMNLGQGSFVYYFGTMAAISLLMFALLSAASWRRNPWARYVGLTIVAFFTIIAASHRMIVPTLVGALLCAADLGLGRRSGAVHKL